MNPYNGEIKDYIEMTEGEKQIAIPIPFSLYFRLRDMSNEERLEYYKNNKHEFEQESVE